jgi:mannosyltransferase
MATYASRPAWELRARALATPRFGVPGGLGGLVALSLLLRSHDLGIGYWIDEGLSVGIADRPLSAIPEALHMDGSPPLYYVLLHFWVAVVGTSEAGARSLSLLFALLAVPAAWWAGRAVFGARTGWIAAVVAALSPFLTQYAQEARMYSLVALLGIPATACFLRAFALPAPSARARRPWALGFAAATAALLYTHNWALFFGAACAAAFAGLVVLAPPDVRRELLATGLIAFGVTALLYLPQLPTTLYQAAHTGAPWAEVPGLGDLLGVPGRLLGTVAQFALLLTAGNGLLSLLNPGPRRRLSTRGTATAALLAIALLTVGLAWAASQVSPAWAPRYLAIAVGPFVLVAAVGLASAGRLGLVGLVVASLMWLGTGAPSAKSNVRDVAEAITPSLQRGDLVVSTQPEQVPVLAHYLPPGLRYATLTGPVRDVGVTDWRDGVRRLEATSAERDLKPLVDRLRPGQRLVLVEPITYDLRRWQAPWTELVRQRSMEWDQYLSNDPRLVAASVQPTSFTPPRPNPVQATVLVKTSAPRAR